MILTSALLCLSLNLYHEARGEMIPGQYAVAMVTMNRAKNNAAEVCKVVLKPHQFSWTTKLVKGGRLAKAGEPKEERAWELSQKIASVVLSGRFRDFTGGAQFYHAGYVAPKWRLAMVKTKVIGHHIFYRNA